MRHALKAQAREDREAGFTLIEILVAMVLMAIIMSSLAVFFIGSQRASSSLRVRQNATIVADEAMDKVHSVQVEQLLLNRDKSSSDTQWASASSPSGIVGVDTSQMTELWDTSTPAPASGAGATAPLPTVPQKTTVNKTDYYTSYFIGTCFVPKGGGDCTKVKPAAGVQMDRVVVAVNWADTGRACPNRTCAYVIASLISPTGDPVFNVNQILVDTTPPSIPSNLKVTDPNVTDVQVSNLTWDASTDASGIGRYDVYRGDGPDFSLSSSNFQKIGTASGNTYVGPDAGLVPSTTYYYVVLAVDSVGNVSGPQVPDGTVTNPQAPFVLTVTTDPDTTAPTAPTTLTATGSTTSTASMSWGAATDDYKVAGYYVYRDGAATPTSPLLPAGSTSWVDTGLSPWTTHTYKVKAVDPAGNLSPFSNQVSIQTRDTSAPTVPSLLTAVNNATVKTQIDLDWTDSTDDVGVTGYTVCRSLSATMSSPTCNNTVASSYASTGLVTNTKYYYTVKAFDAANNISAAATVNATTPDSQAPTAPTGVTATGKTGSSITLGWTASTDNVGVTTYTILRNGVAVGTSPTPSFTDTGLASVTSYGYTITAADAAGNVSPASTAYTVSTLDGTPPTAPTVSATGSGLTTVTLNWTAATDNVGVTGYSVYRNGGPTAVGTTTGSVFTFTDTGLAAGTTYTYTVKANDAAGNYSPASNTASRATTPDTTPPNKVSNVTGSSSSKNTATISWNASSDNVGVATYSIYSGSTLVSTVPSSTLSQLLTGLASSTTYSITVYASDAAGNTSPVSNTLSCVVASNGNVTCS